MDFRRALWAAWAAAALGLGPAVAQDGPAEAPPPGFEGRTFVDSAGCVFVRAQVGGTVTWAPRLAADRIQVCGATPTLARAAPPAAATPATARPRVAPAAAAAAAPVTEPATERLSTRGVTPAVPRGYRAAWRDGRLNPQRGPRTAEGDAQMHLVWSDTTPMRLIAQD